jgi:protein TonB
MSRQDLVSDPSIAQRTLRYGRAFAVSLGFHGLLVVGLIGVCWLYHPNLLIIRNGSASGAPLISLQTVVIVAPVSTPAPPMPPAPLTVAGPARIAPAKAAVVPPQPAQPIVAAHVQPQPAGVPVLAAPVVKSVPAPAATPGAPAQQITSTSATGTGIKHLRPASAKYISSYSPGDSIFPHPPYPPEARDLQQTGIVRMMIHFDAQGNVVEAKVAQSSGVAILDSETRSYIRAHWHSQAYAGQAVTVPVEYTLTSL